MYCTLPTLATAYYVLHYTLLDMPMSLLSADRGRLGGSLCLCESSVFRFRSFAFNNTPLHLSYHPHHHYACIYLGEDRGTVEYILYLPRFVYLAFDLTHIATSPLPGIKVADPLFTAMLPRLAFLT